MPTYIVRTVDYGDIRKTDDCIKDARKWARTALGVRQVINVSREYRHRFCDDCRCTPCCCMVRRDT